VSTRQDRIKGVLLGQAAGDAIGAPFEFKTPPKCGTAKFGWGTFGHEPGEWTDDTAMALCVGLAKSDPEFTALNFLQWRDSRPKDMGNQTRAVLSQATSAVTMAAVARARARRQDKTPVPEGWHPGGPNGSLMRCGPTCLPYLGDRARIAAAARTISDLTHADPWSGDACTIWSLAISDAIERGEAWQPADITRGLDLIPVARRDAWSMLIEVALRARTAGKFRVNGSAVGCFSAALWAVAHAQGLEDGLQRAVSIGHDTDTVAAVAGALLGAWHGASAVPVRYRRRLHGWPSLKAGDLERIALDAARS
jgi:ADP-ribosyl-[dinitrogen reductase] hydrolase